LFQDLGSIPSITKTKSKTKQKAKITTTKNTWPDIDHEKDTLPHAR
jgi:hypothetical protein